MKGFPRFPTVRLEAPLANSFENLSQKRLALTHRMPWRPISLDRPARFYIDENRLM